MEIDTLVPYIEAASFLGAVIAIVLAMLHERELRALLVNMRTRNAETEEQHDALVKELLDIEGSLSTRYLSCFPIYFADIVSLVSEAHQRIVIFCDFPAYGCFSNRKSFLDYRYQLEKKLEQGVDVEITFLNDTARLQELWDQFASRYMSEEFGHNLREFLVAHGVEPRDMPPPEFLGLIEKENIAMTENFLSRARQFPIATHIPVYFWLADDKAIFSIASHSEKTLEHGFRTNDPRLISALIEMKDRYHRGLPPPLSSLPRLLSSPAGEMLVGKGQTEELIDIPGIEAQRLKENQPGPI
jgi:hypothetical protein